VINKDISIIKLTMPTNLLWNTYVCNVFSFHSLAVSIQIESNLGTG